MTANIVILTSALFTRPDANNCVFLHQAAPNHVAIWTFSAIAGYIIVGGLLLYGSQFVFHYTSSSDVAGSDVLLMVVSNIPLFVVAIPVSVLVAWLVRPRANQTCGVLMICLVLLTYLGADSVARHPFRAGFELGVGALISAAVFISVVLLGFWLVRRRLAAG